MLYGGKDVRLFERRNREILGALFWRFNFELDSKSTFLRVFTILP
jgi:hypothetical protein